MMFENLIQDVRYAFRQLRKSPGFAATAIITLTLTIGANTAIYSLFDQVLLRNLPVKDPKGLVVFEYKGSHTGSTNNHGGPSGAYFSYPMYKDIRDRNTVFDGVIASDISQVGLQWHNQPELVNAELVSGNYFDVLGVRPAAGRLFVQADDVVPNGNPLVVLSYSYWQRRFGLDPKVVGDNVLINGHPFTVIGVSAPGFQSMQTGYLPAIYTPMMMKEQVTPGWNDLDNRRSIWLNIIGRLKPGMTMAQAEAGLDSLWHSAREEELKEVRNKSDKFRENFGPKSHLYLHNGARGFSLLDQYRMPMLIVMGMVLLVAVMAAVNVATLLLVRAATRVKEMSVRYAMGARRTRVIQQLLSEGLILGLIGGALGIVLAPQASALLIRKAFADSNGNVPFSSSPDMRVLAFNFGLALLVSLVFSIAPAVQFWRPNLIPALKQQTVTTAGGALRFRRLSVAVQVGVSLVLLVGAGLFVRTLGNLKSADVGFVTQHLITFQIDPQLAGYEDNQTAVLHKRITDSLKALPGVQAVASTADPELANTNSSSNFSIAGITEKEGDDMNAEWPNVSAGYFSAMQIPLITGRDFTESDAAGSGNVAVINETLAKKHFGSPDKAIGKVLARGSGDDAKYDIQIVGVVRDSKHTNVRDEVKQALFTPLSQMQHWVRDPKKPGAKEVLVPDQPGFLAYYVRTWQPTASAMSQIRGAVQGVDSKLVLDTFRTMDAQIDDDVNTERIIALLASGFGILAAILAAVGLYGVLAYSTAQRTREIGVRMALGATRMSVVRMVLTEVLWLAGAGIIVALPVSIVLSRFMRAQLYGVSHYDPLTVFAVVLLVTLVAVAAATLPARRAAGIDPMKALRYE
ncbi:ABC transporter permease [Candidatus Korobacter versatilis]|nr:ABC transporter permease [Candidatus Koribacter versatilis]